MQLTAATFSSYIPNRITEAINTYSESEDTRWDDDVPSDGSKVVIKKPKFHLLIPAHKSTANLCKTLLSAAILNYPPPTLLTYGGSEDSGRPGMDIVKRTFGFLHGKEAHDDDLVLVVEEGSTIHCTLRSTTVIADNFTDAWFQLPAEVTINRFFHGMRDSSLKLLDKYGRMRDENSTQPIHQRQQKYNQTVLFGGAKECSNAPSDPACYSIPQSPLPKDIYGFETDKHSEGKYNRPRYMGSSMVMGRVADLRPIYKRASELLEFEDIGKQGSQYVFSQIFGEQEYARTMSLSSSPGTAAWRTWLSKVLFKPEDSSIPPPNITLNANQDYEYGIGLDYFSSVFQVMNNSAEDIHFVKFDHPSVIASPSKLSAASFKNPIHLPPDLLITPPPFSQHKVSSTKPDPPITSLDDMANKDAPWTDIELATNVIVPGSSVPASLNFHGSESLLDELWGNMWFHNSSRALLRQYIRSPDGPIAAQAAANGGDRWWDLRGGKGGIWTDKGQWLEWNEVCGAHDAVVFGDGKGEFGREGKEVGGQGVLYNAFGYVIGGKGGKDKDEGKIEEQKRIDDKEEGETKAEEPKQEDPKKKEPKQEEPKPADEPKQGSRDDTAILEQEFQQSQENINPATRPEIQKPDLEPTTAEAKIDAEIKKEFELKNEALKVEELKVEDTKMDEEKNELGRTKEGHERVNVQHDMKVDEKWLGLKGEMETR